MVKQQLQLMGILNVTPDSFSDGGQFFTVNQALHQAKKMLEEGANIIDVGGESSGPGSIDVTVAEELKRVIPVVKELRQICGEQALISVDTYKSEVASQAIAAGARLINDVTALRGDEKMAGVLADAGVKVVLMYAKDKSARTTANPVEYEDVVKTIKSFLIARIEFAISRGVRRENIIIDPGMGAFVSANPKYSWEILARLREFEELGCPILIGASRKSFLGGELKERLKPGLRAAKIAVENGAQILRVHNVRKTKEVVSELLAAES